MVNTQATFVLKRGQRAYYRVFSASVTESISSFFFGSVVAESSFVLLYK